MAHKTLVGGTAYDIKGGKTLVGGTAYNIKSGKTLIGGTGYDIKFGGSETWYFNAKLTTSGAGTIGTSKTFAVNFTSNGREREEIKVVAKSSVIFSVLYDNVSAYDITGWKNSNYRTIVLNEPASGDFLKFLNANAVKQ